MSHTRELPHFSSSSHTSTVQPPRTAAKKITREEGRRAPADVQIGSPLSSGNATGPGLSGLKKPELLIDLGLTGEEKILLRGLAAGKSPKEVGHDLRLPKTDMYRLLGELRRKTGTTDDVALAVWVVRHMNDSDRRNR